MKGEAMHEKSHPTLDHGLLVCTHITPTITKAFCAFYLYSEKLYKEL